MNYHIILTRRCDLNCIYCHGGEETEGTEIQYGLDDLAAFLDKDRTSITLLFYGGEPCLRIPLMTEIMDRLPEARFMLQTNGLLMDKIPVEYIQRFHSILVSIDGTRDVTDFYRSKGVYDHALNNVRWLHSTGFEGDIVARMAVSEQSDIYREVTHLLEMTNPRFGHVHWQLNVVWDAEGNWTDFDSWTESSYNPGITRLVKNWVFEMQEGRLGGIVPFLPVAYSLLTGESSTLRCGSGIDTFAIHVDGSIGVCPISPDWGFSIVGNIHESSPQSLFGIMHVEEPCPSCSEFWVCGGRCLFANKQRLWGNQGFAKVCATVRHLVNEIKKEVPRIRGYIDAGLIDVESFNYPKYNNGCEIIP